MKKNIDNMNSKNADFLRGIRLCRNANKIFFQSKKSAKVKNIRKIERPSPLNSCLIDPSNIFPLQNQNVEIIAQKIAKMDILDELVELYIKASNHNFNNEQIKKSRICPLLKQFDCKLDATHKERLDKYFILLYNISRSEELDRVSRLKLLDEKLCLALHFLIYYEVSELRTMHWNLNENVLHYYKTKIAEVENITNFDGDTLKTEVDEEPLILQKLNKITDIIVGLTSTCELRKTNVNPSFYCYLCGGYFRNDDKFICHLLSLKHKLAYIDTSNSSKSVVKL